MKNGYYLSIYTCISPVSFFYNIPLRHDQNMALWKLEDMNEVRGTPEMSKNNGIIALALDAGPR